MDDIKNLSKTNSTLLLSNALLKLVQSIEIQVKKENIKETAIKEIDFLKEQCLSSNSKLCLLSCQTLFRLVENGILVPGNVLTIFMSLITNTSTPAQFTALSEGIINLLLLDMKHRGQTSSNSLYVCPFGLKSPQHPIIMLLLKKQSNIADLSNKINGICDQQNEFIKANALEFLRPVFTYIFCSPTKVIESKSICMTFLSMTNRSKKGIDFLYELISWNRLSSKDSSLHQSIFIIEAIEFLLNAGNYQAAIDLLFYLTALLIPLTKNCFDPRPTLNCIQRTLTLCCTKNINEKMFTNYLLVSLANLIHTISPFYLIDIVTNLKNIINDTKTSNPLIHRMLIDSLTVQLASVSRLLSIECVRQIQELIHMLIGIPYENHSNKIKLEKQIKYFDPMIATNYNVMTFTENLCNSMDYLNIFLKMNHQLNDVLCEEIFMVLRALIIGDNVELSDDEWKNILDCILIYVKNNQTISMDVFTFILRLLAKEENGKRQIELLRKLSYFATVRENIPLILNTYRALSSSTSIPLHSLAIDLHTDLWRIEPRTYQFLHKILIQNQSEIVKQPSIGDQWELNIIKANAIKNILEENASQHGTELIGTLSKILSDCAGSNNELATSIALDAIILLCNSHTVNIASTWKAIKHIFEKENRPRPIQSLCKLLGEVPLLKSSTTEYEHLFDEAIEKLWKFVIDSDSTQIMSSALKALKNFNFTELTLKHFPKIFYENIRIPIEFQRIIAASNNDPLRDGEPLTVADVIPYIPGECWIELISNVNQNVINDAVNLIIHVIEDEVSQYGSGVYMLSEGRAEPTELQHLHNRSPLRAIIKYLASQTKIISENKTIVYCFRCISHKYSRPIPPLNWFFLAEYISNNSFGSSEQFEIQKLALTVAANQIAHSGSAKNLIENFVQNFDSPNQTTKNIEMIIELFPTISDGIQPNVLANFCEITIKYIIATINDDDCQLFDKCIQAMSNVFTKKCLLAENIDIFIDELTKCNHEIDSEHQAFKVFIKHFNRLPANVLERLTPLKTSSWSTFKKSALLRISFVESKKPYLDGTSPLMWLNAIIDECSNENSEIDRMQNELVIPMIFNIIREWKENEEMCDWLLYRMGKTQTVLVGKDEINDGLFSLDIFICAIVILCGYDVYCVDRKNAPEKLIEYFPEALETLSKKPFWNEQIIRIYEFLYHLNTQQANLPGKYKRIACETLICNKNHEYFMKKNNWMRFIHLKK